MWHTTIVETFCTEKEENKMANEVSIENPIFKRFKKAYEYAMEKTKQVLEQSVDGLYHNLNTLN